MAGPRLASLAPLKKFRKPKRAGTKTGTFDVTKAPKEDRKRAELLSKQSIHHHRGEAKQLKKLAKRLSYVSDPPPTLASSAHFHDMREVILDHLVRLAHKARHGDVYTGALLPRRSKLRNLHNFDPQKYLNRFRMDLNRAGGDVATGWVFASVHGEHDTGTGLYEPHYHVIVAGDDMVAVVDRLRKRGKYTLGLSSGEPSEDGPAPPRVQLTRVRRQELRYALSYQLQTWWPGRWAGFSPDGAWIRTRRRRMASYQHAEFLLWLDRQQINHMYLLYGLEVRRKGLRVSKRRRKCA
jgi:hypothetical protein